MLIQELSDDCLEQVSGGLDGSRSGHWVGASVISPTGLNSFSRGAGGFNRSSQFIIPFGEDIPVDMNRKTTKYIMAFYNEQEAWVELSGLDLF